MKKARRPFLYGQNLIFIFTTMWLLREWFYIKAKMAKILVLAAACAFAMIASPNGFVFAKKANASYKDLGTESENIKRACDISNKFDDTVDIQLYHTTEWKWHIARHKVLALGASAA